MHSSSRIRQLLVLLLAALPMASCSDDSAGSSDGDIDSPDAGADVVADTRGDAGGDAGEGDAGAPDPLFDPGPYKVGYKEVEVAYAAPGQQEERVVPVKLWYPAADDTDATSVTYRVAGLVQLQAGLALDAPEPSTDGPFPVAVYSHGSNGEGLLAYPYAELFASHGWVVAAPNHVGNTAFDALMGTDAPFAATALYRVLDITAVLDALEDGLGDPDIGGLSDTQRVFVFGHSFGAYTALAAGGADVAFDALKGNCAAFGQGSCDFIADADVESAFRDGFGDDRVDAIAPQAPGLVQGFAAGEIAGITVPTMLQSGRLDQTTPHQSQAAPAWDALDGPDDVWVEMTAGGHFSFISVCRDLAPEIVEQFQPGAVNDGCGDAFIDIDVALANLRAYLLAFARLHVLGQSEYRAVLEGEPLAEGFVVTIGAD